ncbi:Putative mitochondrial ATPase inhibitor [Septoria linicola]|uniref:ATPase inhibitor, mitochondrial n=1 Tax=Septoria linicola TaxID=215465 RepID=A0A9Q9EP46_9PEZI|nr:Putative mitochondrial ATPase inhibitor [Septoria linicola]
MSALRIVRALPKTPVSSRSFSIAARRSAGGDTGSARSGGAASGDAFTKREEANEAYYIKQHEKEKLEKLKQKIADGEAQLAKDRKEADDILGGKKE